MDRAFEITMAVLLIFIAGMLCNSYNFGASIIFLIIGCLSGIGREVIQLGLEVLRLEITNSIRRIYVRIQGKK